MLKLKQFRPGGWLLASATLMMVSCSQGDNGRLTGPSGANRVALPSVDGGGVGASADGDVKSGAGTLEIFNVRMDRQTSSGASVLRQYANPGGEYAMEVGETIELWAEYRGASNPRFKVSWGDAGSGVDDFTGCGSCLLTHKYAKAGRFRVTVILDDRVNTTVTRTFTLTSAVDIACGASSSVSEFSDAGSSFNDATTATFTPVSGADRVYVSCDECYAHDHSSSGSAQIIIDVHNSQTGGWSQIFSTTLNNAEYYFDGQTYSFGQESSVDRVRFRSVPGQNSSFHSWDDFTITTYCSAFRK